MTVDEASPETDRKPMRGKVVAVTGAASGIGREIARVFAQAGASVATLDINEAALAPGAEEYGCRPYGCDVTDAAVVKHVLETVAVELGGFDILISNAGSAQQGAIGDFPIEELRRSFELNFFGHQNACQAAIQIFRRQGRGGAILFNISNQSVNPGKDFGPYGIPKAATLALMKQYAVDHGREGIRSNGINAGRIRSGLMTEQMIVERAGARGMTPHDYMSGNLLGVEVTASDIADAFLHLAQMEKVNAAVLTVDGGVMATSLR